ncbi:MAG: AraC family transcriptional regulator [Myxococcota bacterium]
MEPFECEIEKEDQVLLISLPTEVVSRILECGAGSVAAAIEPLLVSPHVDPFVSSTTKRIWGELSHSDRASALFVEGAALAIVGALERLKQPQRFEVKHRLSDSEVGRLVDAIEAQLDDSISVGGLAAQIGWRASHMGRAFAERFGQTPQQYVLERRISRACHFLEATEKSIAEIAYECGFSSQQYMTNVFSKRMGTTPLRHRRARKLA